MTESEMTSNKRNEIEPWIGLVHVRPAGNPNALGNGRRGAYVNAVALARSADDFRALVETCLVPDGLKIINISDLAPVREYRMEDRINQEIDDLIRELSSSQMVLFDIFDAYSRDDS